eukprot:UN00948
MSTQPTIPLVQTPMMNYHQYHVENLTKNPIPQIYTPDKNRLFTKLQTVLQGGKEKLKIVSDFDATLSKAGGYSSWCVVENNPEFSDTYRNTCTELFNYYYPLEISPTLTHEQKCEYMIEWWLKAQDALRAERVTREKYNRLLQYAQNTLQLRDGCDVMFKYSNELQIPLLIFSAGIGDIIDSVLLHHFSQYYQPSNPFYPIDQLPQQYKEQKSEQQQQEQITTQTNNVNNLTLDTNPTTIVTLDETAQRALLSPTSLEQAVEHNPGILPGVPRTIYILANHFDFHSAAAANTTCDDTTNTVKRFDPTTHKADDVLCGFYNDRIHVFNKHEELVKKADYYPTQIKPRTNCLLLGDSLGDALMMAADSTDNVVRIAFLNTSKIKNC